MPRQRRSFEEKFPDLGMQWQAQRMGMPFADRKRGGPRAMGVNSPFSNDLVQKILGHIFRRYGWPAFGGEQRIPRWAGQGYQGQGVMPGGKEGVQLAWPQQTQQPRQT